MTTGLQCCVVPEWNLRFRLVLVLTLLFILSTVPLQVSAGSPEIRVVKYAVDEYTVLTEKTVGYTWMEQNLRVYGDGVTHYYLQGPVFVDDPDPAREEELRWNPSEDTNVQEKDMGAVKGSSLRDLCNLVGGMMPGDRVIIQATDGFRKEFAYENIYEPSPRQGEMVITWWKGGEGYVPSYRDGMRLIFFADTGTNQWGIHAMGNWDWHESADEDYWYYYYNGNEKYPTTTGLSIRDIAEISIFSQEEPNGSINVTSAPDGADIYLDGEETGEVTPFTLEEIPAGSHTISVQKDGYTASDEEWIEVSHGVVFPVHFTLEREYSPGISGSGDTSFSSETSYLWEQAPLENVAGVLKGNLSIYNAPGERQVCMSGQTLSYRITTAHHQPQWARLYVFSQAGYTNDQDLEVRVNSMKTGIPDRSTYHLPEGKVTETLALDVTALVQKTGTLEVSIRNPPGGNEWTIYPPVLLVSGEEGEDQARESRVAEGAGVTHAVKEYSPQDLQNITISDFSDIRAGFSGAELVVIGTATRNYHASLPMVVQNSVVIPGNTSDDGEGIWIARFNTTATTSGYTHNELFWNTNDPENAIEFATRVAILSLTYPEKVVSAEPGEDILPDIEPQRTVPSPYGNNLTVPETLVRTAQTPGIPGIEREIPVQDESIISRIWRIIFWLFATPFPDYETRSLVDGDGGVQETLEGEKLEHNEPFSTKNRSPSPITYTLNVSTAPQGAFLMLSGMPDKKTSPATFVLPKGDFLLAAEMDGYLGCETIVHIPGPQEITLVLIQDDTVQHRIQETAPERSRHGGLLIITYPGDLELSVDNEPMESKSPLIVYGAKEGSHTVKATRPSATAGKGESMIARAWIYHDALSICELDFVGIRLDRRIRIIDPSGNSTSFTLNGMYPLLRTPVTLEIPRIGSFVTLIGDGRYTCVAIPDSFRDGTELSIPTYTSAYHAIAIESSPPGAEVFIDGARTGNVTPSTVFGLSEGPHRVMLSLSGYEPAQRVISIPRTDEEFIRGTLSFTLDTYPSGPLQVESIPDGAAIYVDGVATGEKTPCSFSGIPVGVHELTLKSGDITRSRDITIRPDNPNRFVVAMD